MRVPLCSFADRLKYQRRNGDQSKSEEHDARNSPIHSMLSMALTASPLLIQVKPEC